MARDFEIEVLVTTSTKRRQIVVVVFVYRSHISSHQCRENSIGVWFIGTGGTGGSWLQCSCVPLFAVARTALKGEISKGQPCLHT